MDLSKLVEKDFECPLCMSLLYEPLTLNCGHTFCRDCLIKSVSYKKHCPFCRSYCSIDPFTHAATMVISDIVRKVHSGEYFDRQKQARLEESKRTERMGVFFSDKVLFPGQKIGLHVYSPKHRIMFNRAINSSKKFAFSYKKPATLDKERQTDKNKNRKMFVCIASIERFDVFENGKSYLVCKGLKPGVIRRMQIEEEFYGLEMAEIGKIEEEKRTLKNNEEEIKRETFVNKISSLNKKCPSPISEIPSETSELPFWVFGQLLPSSRITPNDKINCLAYQCLGSTIPSKRACLALSAIEEAEHWYSKTNHINGLAAFAILVAAILYIFLSFLFKLLNSIFL